MLSFFSQSRPSKSALSPALAPRSRFLARKMRAFTLVELLVVVAIIGILGIIALPMYSNYATKSKFTEVELATAPIKTFVSTCAVSGDCVSAGAISLGSAAAVGTPATAPPTLNAAQLAIYSVLYPWEKLYDGVALANQYAVSDSATFAASYHMGADRSKNFINHCIDQAFQFQAQRLRKA